MTLRSFILLIVLSLMMPGAALAQDEAAEPAAESEAAAADAAAPAEAAAEAAAEADDEVVKAEPTEYKPPETIEQVLEVLADAIREKNDPMRMRMWFRVREQGAKAAPALMKAFEQYPEMEIKEYMIKCLSWTQDEAAWEFVKKHLDSENVVLRRRATYEINNFDDHRATPLLVKRLAEDADERVRVHACIALGVLDDKNAIEPLKKAYKNDSSELVQQFAKKQLELYEINYPEAKVE